MLIGLPGATERYKNSEQNQNKNCRDGSGELMFLKWAECNILLQVPLLHTKGKLRSLPGQEPLSATQKLDHGFYMLQGLPRDTKVCRFAN